MHKAADSLPRHVWYSPQSNSLKWAMCRSGASSVGGAPAPEKNKERHINVKHMAEVAHGARLFPSQENKGAQQSPNSCAMCFPSSQEIRGISAQCNPYVYPPPSPDAKQSPALHTVDPLGEVPRLIWWYGRLGGAARAACAL